MKAQRHEKIMEIIINKVIETQEELAEELKFQGIEVTQSTVSRDIKELQLIKVPAGTNIYRYARPRQRVSEFSEDRMRRVFSDSVLNLDYSENLIVIRTLPGGAQGVASAVDQAKWPEIIGTVAGDDTILVIVKPKETVPLTIHKFNSLLV